MKSFTDLFIKRPVLALVVSFVILIAGLQAMRTINVRQYPRSDIAAITITTVYVGADAELVRGFITTPLERAIAAADGIDYIQSQSKQGQSVITVRLKLNYDANKALSDISSKVDAIRRDLPPESEIPVLEIQSADSQQASCYLSFTSDILQPNEVTDYLVRLVQPRLTAVGGVQKADILGGRTFAMRIWMKPDRMRTATQGDFSPAEMNLIRQLYPQFLTALGRLRSLEREHSLRMDLEAFLGRLPLPTILLRWNLKPIYQNRAARDFCAVWEKGPEDAQLTKATSPIPSEILDRCRLLKQQWAHAQRPIVPQTGFKEKRVHHPRSPHLRATLHLKQLGSWRP